jgi:carbon-monoxide dehydrogenase small subunit
MSTLQLLQTNADPTDGEVRHAIAGNLCRCTGYQLIVKSVLDAARLMREPVRAGA